jgi:hypothetical protein
VKRDPRDSVELPSQSRVEDELLCALNGFSRPIDLPMMYALLADKFPLSTAQRTALLPFSKENAWENRVRQAARHLRAQGYLSGLVKRQWILTEAGRAKARERERQKSLTPDDMGL